MKMRYFLNILLISFIFLSCTSVPKLSETRWVYEVGEGCVNYIFFSSDSSVNLYNCEVDEIIYGKYFYKQDTIFVQTEKGQYDNEFKEDSRHRHEPYSFYLILKEERLYTAEIEYIRTNK